jgi:plasmid stabilization system protein ParE
MRKILILPFAEQDIKDSVSHYKDQGHGLEKHFLKVIDQAFRIISENPSYFPYVKKRIRKFVIKGFPFCIFYIVQEEDIYILAVFHNKRNPKNWKSRIK